MSEKEPVFIDFNRGNPAHVAALMVFAEACKAQPALPRPISHRIVGGGAEVKKSLAGLNLEPEMVNLVFTVPAEFLENPDAYCNR